MACLAMLASTLPGPVGAAALSLDGQPALELLVQVGAGKWRPTPVGSLEQVAPGELVMISQAFRVPEGRTTDPYTLTVVVPEALDYQIGTAVGPGSEQFVSFDGGLSFGADEPVPAREPGARARVTHIRWIFSQIFQPGVVGYVRYRAKRRLPVLRPLTPEAPGTAGTDSTRDK